MTAGPGRAADNARTLPFRDLSVPRTFAAGSLLPQTAA
jgi:hypothetical protein